MEENKSKNKKIIVIVAVIAVVAIIVTAIGIFVNDYAQRVILSQEIEEINKTAKVNQEIKASGKYGEVEKALKAYITEYQGVGEEIVKECQNEKFATILAASNYEKDGPEFVESKKLINDLKAKGEETKTKLAEMVTDEYKQKKAEEAGLTGKYKDLFISSIKVEQELDTVNKVIDNINNYLSKVDDVFNFLKENKGKWEIKNDIIQFNSTTLLTKYNSLGTMVKIAAQKLTSVK